MVLHFNETKWLLKFIGQTSHGTSRQRYELSKQLQDLHMDVALPSETHLKPYERFFIPNCLVYLNDSFRGKKRHSS
jgi:hypothetical protein